MGGLTPRRPPTRSWRGARIVRLWACGDRDAVEGYAGLTGAFDAVVDVYVSHHVPLDESDQDLLERAARYRERFCESPSQTLNRR